MHVVQDGETLIGIAFTYGITLEELLAANPGVDPRFLSIGHELIIPIAGVEDPQDAQLSVTPIPVVLDAVSCFRTPSNALWCLTAANGRSGETIEGLAALITLSDALGGELANEIAYGPLNLLGAEEIMPLAAFFSPPAPEFSHANATLLSAFESADEGERYLEIEVNLDVTQALPGSTRWQLSGSVSLAAGAAGPAERISVLVVALSSSGEMVGFNVWESVGAVAPGGQLSVALDLFSLGPPIAAIQILAEAQAAQ